MKKEPLFSHSIEIFAVVRTHPFIYILKCATLTKQKRLVYTNILERESERIKKCYKIMKKENFFTIFTIFNSHHFLISNTQTHKHSRTQTHQKKTIQKILH